MTSDYETLAQQLEAQSKPDEATAQAFAKLLSAHVPGQQPAPTLTAEDLASTDRIMHLIDEVAPGWSIHVAGRAIEPDGHWQCSLRRSDSRDNDEFIGFGKGRSLPNALSAALLRTLAYLVGHKQIG